jgi:type IX secretion system PorP/SprF family membrane protein
MKKQILMLLGICAVSATAIAQDYNFSQFYASSLLQNPAFTGADMAPRLMSNFRNQWINMPGKFITYSISGDYYFHEQNSGVGLSLLTDKMGAAGLRNTEISALYAYQLRLSRKFMFRAGGQLGYTRRDVMFDNMVFEDALLSGSLSQQLLNNNLSKSYLNINAGALLYSQTFWLSAAVHHLNMPDQSLIPNNSSPLPMLINLQGGLKIEAGYAERYALKSVRPEDYKNKFYPMFQYRRQGQFEQFSVGATAYFVPIMFGVIYKGFYFPELWSEYTGHDALSFMAGYRYKRLRFTYTYDITVSRLRQRRGGMNSSNEIALAITFWQDEKRGNAPINHKKKMKYRREIEKPWQPFY